MIRTWSIAATQIRSATIVALVVTSANLPMSAQTVISTTGGGAPVGLFGKFGAQTFGQTFTAPSDNILQSFTFFMTPAGSLIFRAYVFAWDPVAGRATGNSLFTSAPIIGPIGSGFIPVTAFLGNGISLLPGSMYAMFFSSSGQSTIGEVALSSNWDSPASDQYSGGAFVSLDNGENTGAFTTQTWSANRQGPGADVRFQALFITAPEPSTLALVAMGLLAVAGLAASRRTLSKSRLDSRSPSR